MLILGAGGITLSLLSLLAPFTPEVTVLRRKADPIEDRFIPPQLKHLKVGTLTDLDTHVRQADVVIVNCALTSQTKGVLSKKQFSLMKKSSIVVNVARGEVINTDDLVIALQEGQIFGAGLDVTHPEPLPDDHPLWQLSSSHPELDVPSVQGGKRANLIIVSRNATDETRAMSLTNTPVLSCPTDAACGQYNHNQRTLVRPARAKKRGRLAEQVWTLRRGGGRRSRVLDVCTRDAKGSMFRLKFNVCDANDHFPP